MVTDLWDTGPDDPFSAGEDSAGVSAETATADPGVRGSIKARDRVIDIKILNFIFLDKLSGKPF